MEDNIVNGIVAEAAGPDVTLPTYDELVAELQTAKMLHANTLTREKLLQEALAEAKALSFEDKLQAMIEKIVANAMDDAMQDLDIDTQIENFIERHIDDYVRNAVEDLSFEVTVR